MAIAFNTPGPIHHFAVFRDQSTVFYMGTAVLAPEQEGEKFKIPVLNDMGGRSVPFQLIQDGEYWMVQTTMNRFDQQVTRKIRSLEGAGAPLGQEGLSARGRLVLGISDWSLILLNEYAAIGNPIASANPELNPMRCFFSANMRMYKESTVGTRVLEVAMAIECQNLFNPANRGFKLYAENQADSAPLNINPTALLALVV